MLADQWSAMKHNLIYLQDCWFLLLKGGISPQLSLTVLNIRQQIPQEHLYLGDCRGFLEALSASTVRRVLICSRVSRALSSTSVESAEVERVVIGLVATAHSVPTGNRPGSASDR